MVKGRSLFQCPSQTIENGFYGFFIALITYEEIVAIPSQQK